MTGRFLAVVGALIRRESDGKYLLLQRSDSRDVGAGEWECVTGRLEQGESFEAAMHREVREEVGIQVQIDFIVRTAHFYRGAEVPENEAIGVVYACTAADVADVQISDEHSTYRWVTSDEPLALQAPDHLAATIARAEALRRLMPRESFEDQLSRELIQGR